MCARESLRARVRACSPVRHVSVRWSALASQVLGVQRCKARVRPKRGRHVARERVILEIDPGHCWQQGDRVGDGADEAVPLAEAAPTHEGINHSDIPRRSLCEGDALRQRFERNKRCRREERAALHAHKVRELADRCIDRPVERVPRQVAARMPQAPAPNDAEEELHCASSAHTGMPGVRHEGICIQQQHEWIPARSSRVRVSVQRPSRILDSLVQQNPIRSLSLHRSTV